MEEMDQALDLMGRGCNCSQAVLTAFGRRYGIDAETAMDLGRALGGGMGRLGLTCGAVSGAVLVMGLAGREEKDEMARRKLAYGLTQELVSGFTARHGSIVCKDLLGVDLNTAEGAKLFAERELYATLCPNFVGEAARLLARLLPAAQAEKA